MSLGKIQLIPRTVAVEHDHSIDPSSPNDITIWGIDKVFDNSRRALTQGHWLGQASLAPRALASSAELAKPSKTLASPDLPESVRLQGEYARPGQPKNTLASPAICYFRGITSIALVGQTDLLVADIIFFLSDPVKVFNTTHFLF